jgi:hypothetical protein
MPVMLVTFSNGTPPVSFDRRRDGRGGGERCGASTP